MLKYVKGDIFNSPAQVLVNTVNTVGVMAVSYTHLMGFCKRYIPLNIATIGRTNKNFFHHHSHIPFIIIRGCSRILVSIRRKLGNDTIHNSEIIAFQRGSQPF